MHDLQTPGAPPRPADPYRLDYFAAAAPYETGGRRARGVTFWSVLLAAGWLPYACGVLNGVVVSQSYSSHIIQSHSWGAVLFMGAGLVLSLVALGGFVRLRHRAGIVGAAGVAGFQVAVGLCVGLMSA